jgi:chaperone required for assembly of F1-ATPase
MREILYPAHEPSDPNPLKRAQAAMARQKLPKRFYQEVDVDNRGTEGFAIRLDGRTARTPGRKLLALPTLPAAEVVAAEWRAQADVIDPARMHATRMTNTALDSFAGRIAEIQADVASFAGSDLVCYRAGEPEGLIAAQTLHWTPVLAWADQVLGARFRLATGVMHQQQDEAALAAVSLAVGACSQPVRLAALHVMTTLTGSCLIALMAAGGSLDADAAWQAATVDDEWSASLWGPDEEAAARMARRREEFGAAYALNAALAP